MFGGNVVITKAMVSKAPTKATDATKVTSESKPVTRLSVAKQTTMSSFLLDSMIVDNNDKKKRAAKAAATRAANKKDAVKESSK
jgi:hypothetical protein